MLLCPLNLQVHVFGASLGGFLAQKFAEYTHKSPRVHSLILCNSFSDTSIFNQTWTANRWISMIPSQTFLSVWTLINVSSPCPCLLSFWLMPAFMLKKIVLGNFAKGPVDPKMADAIDFMVDRVSGHVDVMMCYQKWWSHFIRGNTLRAASSWTSAPL